METILHAPHDGEIMEVFVSVGTQVDTKNLLMEIIPNTNVN
jgi:pyruvate carboxylase